MEPTLKKQLATFVAKNMHLLFQLRGGQTCGGYVELVKDDYVMLKQSPEHTGYTVVAIEAIDAFIVKG
jgi:hypothetical protein